jgi:saccharopine dehydrogenase (NAD+, L-lysine-forming)
VVLVKVTIVGCGAQGSALAGRLAREPDTEKIVLADIILDRAKWAASQVRGLKGARADVSIEVKQVNAANKDDVARVARGSDFIFNATFPPFNIPIMKACLEVGAHYADLWSLPSAELPGAVKEHTVDAQLELDEAFRRAGLTAVPCTGAAPGFTDVAARYIAEQLDTVDKIKAAWCERLGYVEGDRLIGIFAPREMMGEFFSPFGPIVYERGRFKEVDLVRTREEIECPEPTGKVVVYAVCTHPELRTIPIALGKIGKTPNYVEMKGGAKFGDLTWDQIAIKAIKEAILRERTTSFKEVDLLDLWGKSFTDPVDTFRLYKEGKIKDQSVTFPIIAEGTKGGKRVRYTVYGTVTTEDALKDMPYTYTANWVTSMIPLVVITMVCRGEYKERGVHFCGELPNPKQILDRVRKMGMRIRETIEEVKS